MRRPMQATTQAIRKPSYGTRYMRDGNGMNSVTAISGDPTVLSDDGTPRG